jgi:membrane fusion protein (multidrug efflux system)
MARKLVIRTVIAVVLIVALIVGARAYRFSLSHVSTDDAYVTGDLVEVSPIIGGTLARLQVSEGDAVKKGQLIARLDDSGPLAALRQAQAAEKAAASQIPQAERGLAFAARSTDAGIRSAQAAVAAQQTRVDGAQDAVTLSADTVRNQIRAAESGMAAADAQAASAAAQATQADAQVNSAEAARRSLLHAVEQARRASNAAAASVVAARANAERASKDEARFARLVKLEAVTQQQYDSARTAAEAARAQLTAAQESSEQARSAVDQARSTVDQADAQIDAARKQAAAAHRQADAARQQVSVAEASLGLAKAGATTVRIHQAEVAGNIHGMSQAQAEVATALAGQEQVAVRQKQIETARAQRDEARAAVQNAEVMLSHTYIYAPCDGIVVKKIANVGSAMSPGQPIVVITQETGVWVSANFKEIQVTDVKPGQNAEIEVDTFPGKVFRGKVHSINRATGAATAILPPDNATGNFTKVVQRIPIKIVFESTGGRNVGPGDIAALRQGMSVVATIDTAGGGR